MINYLRLADRVFNQPLLATETMAANVAKYLNVRMFGNGQPELAVNFNKPKGDASQYLRVAEGTAVLPIMGALTHRASGMDALCTGGMSSYAGMTKAFDEAMADPSVERVVLHVDSGGGEAVGCFDLADHIMANRGNKPIIAYVDGMACSAAYALACTADEVIASPNSEVGSIGVIMVHQDYSEMLAKEGIKSTIIKAGANKGAGSPYEPLTEDAKNALQGRINSLYSAFVGLVSTARNISAEVVRGTEASVYDSQEGLNIGLVDSIKSPDEFLEYLSGNNSDILLACGPNKKKAAMAEETISQDNEMSEQEMAELAELRAFKAQQEMAAQMTEVVVKIKPAAEAIGFDANAAAGALLAVGLDNELSKLFMSVVESSAAKMAEMAEAATAAAVEHEKKLAEVQETAQAAVEESAAMEEAGVSGAAEVEAKEEAVADDADPRKAALNAAIKQMLESGNFSI